MAIIASFFHDPLRLLIISSFKSSRVTFWTVFDLSEFIKDYSILTTTSGGSLFSEMSGLFSSLHISFSTSIAGLEVSAIMGFLLLLMRHKQDSYFRDLDTSATTMLALVRNSINKNDFTAEFEQIFQSHLKA